MHVCTALEVHNDANCDENVLFFFLSYANVLPIERLIISLSILVYTRIYKTSGTLRSEVICRNRIDPAEIISQKVAKSFRE